MITYHRIDSFELCYSPISHQRLQTHPHFRFEIHLALILFVVLEVVVVQIADGFRALAGNDDLIY